MIVTLGPTDGPAGLVAEERMKVEPLIVGTKLRAGETREYGIEARDARSVRVRLVVRYVGKGPVVEGKEVPTEEYSGLVPMTSRWAKRSKKVVARITAGDHPFVIEEFEYGKVAEDEQPRGGR